MVKKEIKYETYGYDVDNLTNLAIAKKLLKVNMDNIIEDFKQQLDFSDPECCNIEFFDRETSFIMNFNVCWDEVYEWTGGDGYWTPNEIYCSDIENFRIDWIDADYIVNNKYVKFTEDEKQELENIFLDIVETMKIL